MSAFPLTPLIDDRVDEPRFAALIDRLVEAQVDSIAVLGSTGSYAYLTEEERMRVAELAKQHSGSIPLIVGVSALRTSQAVRLAKHAEQIGADAILVAPMTYQALTEDDVFGLYEAIAAATPLPLIVYDNPGTTHFNFSLDLYTRLGELPSVVSIKIPGSPLGKAEARVRVDAIRAAIPSRVTIGISGDAYSASMLEAGCDAWYSVIGGTLPKEALAIVRAAQADDHEQAREASAKLQPIWDLFAATGGSNRVAAALAEELGLAERSSLPLPIIGLNNTHRAAVAQAVTDLNLRE